MEGRKHSEEEEEETVELSIRVSFENFSRLGCTLFDRYRQDASSFAFVSSRRERGEAQRILNELKEEASSNQSSRDGFSLNVLRGNRVCYGGLSETIFFFLRGI